MKTTNTLLLFLVLLSSYSFAQADHIRCSAYNAKKISTFPHQDKLTPINTNIGDIHVHVQLKNIQKSSAQALAGTILKDRYDSRKDSNARRTRQIEVLQGGELYYFMFRYGGYVKETELTISIEGDLHITLHQNYFFQGKVIPMRQKMILYRNNPSRNTSKQYIPYEKGYLVASLWEYHQVKRAEANLRCKVRK